MYWWLGYYWVFIYGFCIFYVFGYFGWGGFGVWVDFL